MAGLARGADLVERHYDYVFKTGTLTANQILTGQQQKINADAPFILRSLQAFIEGAGGQTNELSMRFADANGRFRSNTLLNLQPDLDGSLGFAQFAPIYPQIVYPPNSNIEIDLRNDLGSSRAMSIVFQGITLHPRGSVYAPQFPAKFALIPFVYPINFQIVRGAASVTLSDQVLQVKSDADFLFTHGQVLPDSSQGIGNFNDLRIRLKDVQDKYYSSDYVPINLMLGNNFAENPGLVYPGIYIEKNGFLRFDLQLNDTGGAATLFGQIAFNGFKVFPK